MNDIKTMKIDAENLKQLMEEYYKGTIRIEKGTKYVGFYEDRVVDIKIILITNGNYGVTFEEQLTEENVKEVLTNSLELVDYEIIDITYNANILYADRPWDTEKVNFSGVTATLKKKQMQKKL